MRFFLELSYNGCSYHGWQSQPNARSVQATIEDALHKVLRNDIKLTGAGRTDAGVHAYQMYAHFDYKNLMPDKHKLLLSLNSIVGKNINIKNIIEVKDNCHARFDAIERTYKYFITFNKNPFFKEFCCSSSSFLDFDEMNKASKILLSTNDFTSFAKLHSDTKTNICNVKEAKWEWIKDDKEAYDFIGGLNEGYVFTIKADRFLRNMVRAIVGTLIEVGRKKIGIEEFSQIIKDQNRCSAGTSMPAQGLYLWHISYPFLP